MKKKQPTLAKVWGRRPMVDATRFGSTWTGFIMASRGRNHLDLLSRGHATEALAIAAVERRWNRTVGRKG